MILYLIVFLVFTIMCLHARSSNGISKRAFAACMFCLFCIVGFADMLGGYDRYIYCQLFDNVANGIERGSVLSILPILTLYGNEMGYVILNVLIAHVTANRYIFILIVSGLMYWLFYKSMAQEVSDLGLALLLFLGLYFFFTFTYIRQVIAVGFIWYSYRYIYTRQLVKFLIFLVLAVSFHNSALLFLPMYFIANMKSSRKTIIICVCICCIIGLSGYPSIIFELYGEASDSIARANGYMMDTSGFRFEYVLEAVVFLWYILSNYHNLQNTKKDRVHLNIAVCFCCILLLFCKSLNGGRLSWPFMLGLISILTGLSKIPLRRLPLLPLSLICLSFILYLRILIGWGVLVSPYKTFLTPGVREGDYICVKYEYDRRYSIDKFYR